MSDPKLTAREREVLELASQGLSNETIASYLGIALGTVRRHTKHVTQKLQAENRAHAVRRGFETGYLTC